MRTCTICAHPERTAIDAALIAGVSLRDIARQLNVGKDALNRHRTHLTDALRTRDEDRLESAALVKRLELERLDELFRAWWPAAIAGKSRAAAIILRIMERRARLEGLDAPVAVKHSGDRKRPLKVQGRIAVAESPSDLLATVDALEVAGVVPLGSESALHAAMVALDPDLDALGRDNE